MYTKYCVFKGDCDSKPFFFVIVVIVYIICCYFSFNKLILVLDILFLFNIVFIWAYFLLMWRGIP